MTDKTSRLWKLCSLNQVQQRIVDELWTSDGVCVCGRPITKMDAKICLAQVHTSWAELASVRNTLAVGIYCGFCAQQINMLLKSLKKLPEPDKLKRQQISGE